jgi:penicillin-binding protein 1C
VDFPVSPVVLDDEGRIIYSLLAKDGQWSWPVSLKDMGPWLPKIAVAAEDGRFYSHFGIDPLALLRAIGQNILAGKIVSGASTISAQTIRLLNPAPRGYGRKALEFVQAVKLERRLSKDEILEIYLNLAPFGGNVRGVGAASYAYFNKKPADLSLAESAALIAVLRGPAIYRLDRFPEKAKKRRDLILARLKKKGAIAPADLARALTEPLTAARFPMPREAPNFSAKALKNSPREWTFGALDYKGLKTTLNSALQRALLARLTQALAPFPSQITGAGAIVDSQTGAILAYVGNARPKGPAGQVDCAAALRSPGSALKPFVYLAAMEKGLIGPATLLADTPLGLDGRAPRNFDRLYRGPVSAQKALANSLNAPAARVARLLGAKEAKAAIARAGFSLIPGRGYGDSLVLGGVEVSLIQLAYAYAALGRGGGELAKSLDNPLNDAGRAEFTPAGAFLVNQALTDNRRLPYGSGGEGFAFKSGTSHGYRDAWLAIYDPGHAAVLWLGDPKGRGFQGLSGLSSLGPAAALLAGDIGRGPSWPNPPEEVESYLACPLSGEPVGVFCPKGVTAYRLKAGAKTRPCGIHARRNGETVTVWPRELAGFMASPTALRGPTPTIVFPARGAVIKAEANEARLPLRSEGTYGPTHWFLDGEFFAVAGPGRAPLLSVAPGRHRVSLVDGLDRTALSEFTVLAGGARGPETPIIKLRDLKRP